MIICIFWERGEHIYLFRCFGAKMHVSFTNVSHDGFLYIFLNRRSMEIGKEKQCGSCRAFEESGIVVSRNDFRDFLRENVTSQYM